MRIVRPASIVVVLSLAAHVAVVPPARSEVSAGSTIAGKIVPHPCLDPASASCKRMPALAQDRTIHFLRDERSGDVYALRVEASVSTERAGWLAPHGARVKLTGRAYEQDGVRWFAVEDVARAHDHDAAPHGGVVGMYEDRHLELVSPPDGDVRIYLLDAFMQPLSAERVTGSARIRDRAGTARTGRVRPSDDGRFLIVEGDRRRATDDDVTVDIEVGGKHVTMTLPFAPAPQAGPGDGHGPHEHHH